MYVNSMLNNEFSKSYLKEINVNITFQRIIYNHSTKIIILWADHKFSFIIIYYHPLSLIFINYYSL